MSEWITVLIVAGMAGLSVPAGALLASVERIRPDWLEEEFRHSIIAFGGGALLSAVALVLVPDGMHDFSLGATVLWFTLGGLGFFALDWYLARRATSASQLAAMLADFLPEALALGAVFASGADTALLLAVLIALQNLPESFNAYREIRASTRATTRRILLTFTAIALLGPAVALSGFFFLFEMQAVVSAVMLFASGGILYLVFQDIAPQARLERHWAPPLGAVAGFLMGMIGHAIIGGG
jgi:ZIP family zinc transporter